MTTTKNLNQSQNKVMISMGYDHIETNITLSKGNGDILPDPSVVGSYNIIWWNASDYESPTDDPFVEIVKCIAKMDDIMIVMRSQQQTSASPKNMSGKLYNMTLLPDSNLDILSYYNLPQTHGSIRHDATVETPTGSQSKVDAHSILTTTHGSSGTILGLTTANATYAPIANGVTNGNSHDHNGGDGAQINHTTLSNIGTNTHAAIDTAIGTTLPGLVTTHAGLATAHGATGAVVGTTNSQTLTNKSIYDSSSYILSDGLKNTTGSVYITNSAAPTTGQVLTATSPYYANWQNPSSGGAVPTGTVLPYAGTTAPTGYLLCNGAAVSRSTYSGLFAAISTAYGAGDGSTTFNVPDFLGRSIIGAGSGSGLTARTRGDKAGEETHVLSVTELATHSHGGVNDYGNYGMYNGGSDSWGWPMNRTYATANTGSNTAHNNMQPFGVANYIIKT